jgi:hypothetical protein
VTTESLQTRVFYASAAHTIIGPVMDQADIVPDFRDGPIQNHAVEAIRRFASQISPHHPCRSGC